MQIIAATAQDLESIARMMILLWPECQYEEELENNRKLLASDKDALFLALVDEQPSGFVHISLRYEYVEGTESSPVGYVEGIFVQESFRKTGIGRAMIDRGAEWSKARGCKELASDTEVHNLSSIGFHKSLGFEEKNRVVCFSKKLD